ncbi:hypothetical protein DH2020_041637 [Rehmannia glutinosa]|uniref:C3H1-type domain-containing protein n=1 Tax=Rehmannia glutinosa TaxID=99300 RepID=A0ABR0UQQ5_REHGL
MDTRKRGIGEFGLNSNGGFKKSKPAQMMNHSPAPAAGPLPIQNGSAPAAAKTKLCNKYGTPEGCKFNDKCLFAHGEMELRRPITQSQEDLVRLEPPFLAGFCCSTDPPVPTLAASFGASATAKISVDASLAGAIIGKGGVNSKQICRQTGVKLSIREHETDTNLRNIELEGTFEQIKEASGMLRELIVSIGSASAGQGKRPEALGVPLPQEATSRLSFVKTFPKGRAHLEIGAILHMGRLSYEKQGYE